LSKQSKAPQMMQTALAKVIVGDCLDVLSSMRSESVDLVLTSPPYNIGKDYEKILPIDEYLETQRLVIGEAIRVLKPEGSICWQVGFTRVENQLIPLDLLLYPIFKDHGLKLKNRIIWTFGHGMHASKRFSGRHETILWFVKDLSKNYFDLDAVRVPQKYPGKRHYKGPNRGSYSGNPLGKNPGDVWEIPNVKANHVEKTEHQCQFPIALAQRVIKALSPKNGVVLDPFSGVGTTACAASLESRQSISIEQDFSYAKTAFRRIQSAEKGTLKIRQIDTPIYEPEPGSKLVRRED
jgi:adenine-specific DNA-methyltransferase